jgi:hypothetical protein
MKRTRQTVALFSLLLALLLSAQTPDAPSENLGRTLRDASRALQAGNAVLFLSHFDKKQFPGYARLESHIVVLTRQADVASSIEIIGTEAEDKTNRLTVDWLLQLTPSGGFGPATRRREEITIRFDAAGGKPKIISLAPVDFFRPL